jgi:hypothetical protein
VVIKNFPVAKGSRISLLGTGARLKWKSENDTVTIMIPSLVQTKWQGKYAAVFKVAD